ncbi:MAG: PEGA domain-containing protein [Deltaproteobacteria bacterium]|nr:PEGA domain-containing protein [Deltaproteobacteria bacterium]
MSHRSTSLVSLRSLSFASCVVFSASAFGAAEGASTEVATSKTEPAAGEPVPAATAVAEVPPPEETGTKVLVLPYQAIYRSVPQERLDEATRLLQSELDRRDGVIVVKGAQAQNAAAPTLDVARQATSEADKAEAEKRADDAVREREAAVAAYDASPSAIEAFDEYLTALHALARAHTLRGDDDRAKATIEVAARMVPTFLPPATSYSRIHRRWSEAIGKKVPGELPGELLVNSALPGAQIWLDGRSMEVAPVLIQKVLPGKHVVRATVEGVPAFGAIVTVQPGKKTELLATFSGTAGGDSVGRVTDAISINALPPEAILSAATAGKDSGAAFVVFGAMAKAENRYTLHTYVVSVAEAKLSALEVASFDLDMLTAESDVLKIVRAANGRIESFTKPEPSVAKIEPKLRPESTIKTVSGAPQVYGAPAQIKGPIRTTPRGPIRSLSGSTVEIKDEEGTE